MASKTTALNSSTPTTTTTTTTTPYTRESIWACLPSTTRGQPIQLDAHPNGSSFLYTNGRSVIIRDLKNPESSSEYTGHAFPVTVARYAPSGYYIASGDVRGNLRIWDCTQSSQLLKQEYQLLSGSIMDLVWDFESKRLIVCGEGREKFACAILFDTGSSVGEIVGHNKMINSVSVKPSRPFKAVTCSNDMTVNFYTGVPYKFVHSLSDHSRFVTCVKYSPCGLFFVSVGLDSKLVLYDGESGVKVNEFVDDVNKHTGGIFSVAWSPDSKQILTSSSDCKVKLWDVQTQKVLLTWTFGDSASPANAMNHQVSTLWTKQGTVLSVSLSGDIHYLDVQKGTVLRTLVGHQKSITSLAKMNTGLITGSYDGTICQWSQQESGAKSICSLFQTDQTLSQIQDLCVDEQHLNSIVSIHLDDTLRTHQSGTTSITKLPEQPKALALAGKGLTYIVSVQGLLLVDQDQKKVETVPVSDLMPKGAADILSICISQDKRYLALGTSTKHVCVYELQAGQIDRTKSYAYGDQSKGQVTALAFSQQQQLAVGDSSGKIIVYDIPNLPFPATTTTTSSTKLSVQLNEWGFHTARITSIHWHVSGMYACSSSLDTCVGIWSVAKPASHYLIRNAHVDSVNCVVWVDIDSVASVGNDACVKHWKLVKLPGV